MIKILIFLIFSCLIAGCSSVEDVTKSNDDLVKADFIAGCMKSGELIEAECTCIYQDLQKNYDKNFATNAALLEDGSKEDLIFQKKLIESSRACNVF